MIRALLPAHLRTLARVEGEVEIHVEGPATLRAFIDALDASAMGRFFPSASLDDALAQIRRPNNASYNDTFTYPRGGAEQYIHALLRDLHPLQLALGENVKSIDLDEHIVTTSKRRIAYHHLVTSAPLADTLAMTNLGYDAAAFTANQVLVFNLGFDTKGRSDAHWVYFSDPSLRFYRVGYYDNIHADDAALSARMSLYVEIGLPEGVTPDIDAERARVLADLARAGVLTTQRLVSSHAVTMRPAYVHITARSLQESRVQRELLRSLDVHSIGRYGAWTYCSIEDNIVEARAVAARLAGQ